MKLLIVDEDIDLCLGLREFFRQSAYAVDFELDGESGLARTESGDYDLVIVDAHLPGLNGLELLRRIRSNSQIPVLILSAKADQDDRIAGLEMGADDYLSKPFFPDELLARIRAILRRTTHLPRAPQALCVGELCLIPGDRDVSFGGKPLGLTPMECEILERLMRFRGRVVSRDSLTLHLYNRLASPLDRSVDTHVSRIRRKLGSGRTMLMSIRGIGYQLRCPENPGAEIVKPADERVSE
jgi:DNA-binding response OmpR family regulator